MDGVLIATVASSGLAIVGVMAGGFWKLSSRISDHSRAVGRLEGRVEGLDTQVGGLSDRIEHLDERINGIVDKGAK